MQKLIIQVGVLVSLAVISNGYASNLELSPESKNFYESCLNMVKIWSLTEVINISASLKAKNCTDLYNVQS